jgi:phosphatidylinositol alpha-1,6-mannosyltransferase
VLRGAVCCIANSRNTQRLLCERWDISPERVHVLNPGVDTKYFSPADRDLEIRRRLGWNDRPILLTVGRLQRRKGQDMLIRALPAIRDRLPDVLYSIVGEGEERESLEELAAECGVASQVQFLGNVGDVELLNCYRQCDLFALPNREIDGDIEGFGMVLLEAQACGRPVIAGQSGGTSETMRVGVTGEIVDCTSPQPLAATVVRLMSDSAMREAMGLEARRRVVELFDWDTLASKARELFESKFNEGKRQSRPLASAAASND